MRSARGRPQPKKKQRPAERPTERSGKKPFLWKGLESCGFIGYFVGCEIENIPDKQSSEGFMGLNEFVVLF